MPIDPETVRKTAHLARLELGPDEIARYQTQLGAILDYVAQLEQLDVSKVEPLTQAGDFSNVFRSDAPAPSLTSDQALANAPEKAGPYFVVPKVVE
jgi:aspartyl-tRNA(Asn)/glutamyl-tRNA(Gln) amidotransferase subunit C